MRISRLMLNTTLALSLPLMAYGQQSGAPVIPRAEPESAPSGAQPLTQQPGTGRAVQPGQAQPAQPQPGQPQPGQLQPGQARPGQPQPGQTVIANKPIVGDQANQQASQQVATLLAICNQKEVKLAELAKNKSENKDVKEFAEMMIKDHSESLRKLAQHGGQSGLGMTSAPQPANRTTENTTTTTNQGNVAATQGRPTTGQTSATSRDGLDFVAVQRQAAQLCLDNAQKKWSEEKAAECDMAYIGAQVVAHEEMIVQAKALRPYASPELQKEIDNSIQTAEQHRDEAHKIIKKLGEEEKKNNKS